MSPELTLPGALYRTRRPSGEVTVPPFFSSDGFGDFSYSLVVPLESHTSGVIREELVMGETFGDVLSNQRGGREEPQSGRGWTFP